MTTSSETHRKVYQTEREQARLFNLKKSFPLPRKVTDALDEWHNKNKPKPEGHENETTTE